MANFKKQRQAILARPPQPNEEFVAHCVLPSHPRAPTIALAVRRAIGVHARMDVGFVTAEDRIPEDLGDIFVRDSLDVIGFFIMLEDDLRVRVPEAPIIELLSRETVTVKEIVNRVCDLVINQL
jgi:hypothetical protein